MRNQNFKIMVFEIAIKQNKALQSFLSYVSWKNVTTDVTFVKSVFF